MIEGKCAERKAHAILLEYHLDLQLQGDYESIMDIGKECISKGFPAHLFPFIIVIGLSKYGAIEVGLKYHSHGQKLRKDGKEFSILFGNILIFHADTFHKSVLPAPWNEALRVSIVEF